MISIQKKKKHKLETENIEYSKIYDTNLPDQSQYKGLIL